MSETFNEVTTQSGDQCTTSEIAHKTLAFYEWNYQWSNNTVRGPMPTSQLAHKTLAFYGWKFQ
jgi:hypothetical protein